MNREILYRGKRVDNGEWIEGALYPNGKWLPVFDKDDMYIGNDEILRAVVPKTVGEFTGCTDKNGKKIFESDITKHRSNYSGNFTIAVVIYSDEHFLAMTDDNTGFSLSDRLEVIGNIHDNPELLEAEK